jgi:NAD-dependent DNA ligase
MIRGIGRVYARKMVKAFGEKVFDVIEAEPDRLREVDGIGPPRAQRITAAWAEQKIVREIMVFLHCDDPQEPRFRISCGRHPELDPALRDAATQPALHRRDPWEAARDLSRPEESGRIAVRNVSGRRRWSKLRNGWTPGR